MTIRQRVEQELERQEELYSAFSCSPFSAEFKQAAYAIETLEEVLKWIDEEESTRQFNISLTKTE